MERALLKCNDNNHTVSVNNHVYPIVDGFVFIDVRPFIRAERYIENPDSFAEQKRIYNPLHDPSANAETDATEICRIVVTEEQFGVLRRFRLFEPPTKDERTKWLSDPANLARWEGITVEEAERLLESDEDEPEVTEVEVKTAPGLKAKATR